MGQMLGTPVSSQYIQRYGDAHLRVGSSHMQGARPTMEDADTVLLELPGHPRLSFFGVFDGHAGEQVSEYLGQELYKAVAALEDPMDPEQVRAAVLEVDRRIGELPEIRQSGSTSCFVVLERPAEAAAGEGQQQEGEEEGKQADAASTYRLLVSNVGDSRALILHPDGSFEALTEDHKPDQPAEGARIVAAGGHVSMGRVDGQLAMSRAMGDFGYKDNEMLGPELQKVTAVADISVHTLHAGDSILVFCDGVVEQLSNEAVAKFVHDQQTGKGVKQGHGGPLDSGELEDPSDPGAIVYNLLHHSVTAGSMDNHSAIMVQLKSGIGYGRDPEFVPGPFGPFQEGDRQFRQAFLDDAKRHGVSDPAEAARLAEAADARLPAGFLEAHRSGAGDHGADPLSLLRLMGAGGGGGGSGGGGEDMGLEFEQRMQLLEMLSSGRIQLVRPEDPEWGDDDEQDDDDDDDDEDEDGLDDEETGHGDHHGQAGEEDEDDGSQ